jgi:hypothetical protein
MVPLLTLGIGSGATAIILAPSFARRSRGRLFTKDPLWSTRFLSLLAGVVGM